MDFYIGGKRIKPGAIVKSFRNEPWRFERISREPEPGKSGKVYMTSMLDKAWRQELYPHVFDGEIK